MALTKRNYVSGETVITAKNLNEIQDSIIELESNAVMGLSGLAADDQIMVSAVDADGKPTGWRSC